jgi:hypothetical protein
MQQEKAQIILELIGQDSSTQKVFKTMNVSMKNLKSGMTETTTVINTQNKRGEIMSSTYKKLTPTVKKFKMEWLSVMFAGMALTRVFGGVIKSQMDLWGVTNTLSSMWKVVMLDAMAKVSDALIELMLKVMDLPDDTKMVISFTVLGISALGTVMATIGQIYLGALGIGMAFPKIATAIAVAGGGIMGFFKVVWAFVSGLFTLTAGIVAAIVLIIIGMIVAWKENFMGMKKIVENIISSIKDYIKSFVQVFVGIMQIIKGIFTGDFNLIKEGFMNVVKGFANSIIALVNIVIQAVLAIAVGIIRILAGIIQGFINAIISAGNAISKLLGIKGTVQKVDLVGSISKWDLGGLKIPSFKTGGVMPYTGLAQLHAGERIIPNGQSNNSNTNITVNASISNDYDVRKLADEINKYLLNNYDNSTKRRS